MIEAELIAAIEADPDDPAPRLVYADWLAQRGDPRAELVQLDARMWQTPIHPARVRSLMLLRGELAQRCEPGWLARMQRPSFAELRRRVGVVAMIDPERARPDARTHDYALAPPLSVTALEAIEARIGGRLPEDYRRFVTEVGDGGAGPVGVMRSLAGTATPALMTPFPLDGTAAAPVDLDSEDDPPGALQLVSCDYYVIWLITAGAQAGAIWREMDDGFEPVRPAARTEFLPWYLSWLEQLLRLHVMKTADSDDVFGRDPREVLHLLLGGRGLAEVPDGLRRMRHVRRLSLSEPIEVLPDWIDELADLEFLALISTRLRGLPASIGALRNLRFLHLVRAHELAALPDSIGRLSRLAVLLIRGSRITTLPDVFDGLPLVELFISETPLVALPPSVGRTKITQLSLVRTELTALPDEMAALTELERLDLSGNRFAQLPAWISTLPRLRAINLGDMPSLDVAGACRTLARIPSLREVSFDRNGLAVLPPDIGLLTQIDGLSVADNALTELPPELAKLTRLSNLGVTGNPLPEEPA